MPTGILTRVVDLIIGKRVLELGSGIGFMGTIVSSLQMLADDPLSSDRSKLWLTDVDETVLSVCRSNISLPCSMSLSSSTTAANLGA